MIRVTRLDGSQLYVNAEHVQSVEGTPDTHIVLTNGQSYITRETVQQVADRVLAYQRHVRGTD